MATYNAAVYAVEVDIDRDTGAVRVRDALQVVDVGTVINPTAHQGQLNGGFAFGFGAALMEDLALDESGKVVALSLGEYKLPTQMDMPPLRTVLLRTEVGPGPFGSKAVGEVTNSGVAPAIANAIARRRRGTGNGAAHNVRTRPRSSGSLTFFSRFRTVPLRCARSVEAKISQRGPGAAGEFPEGGSVRHDMR